MPAATTPAGSPYAPDRAFALLLAALTLGLTVIWLVSLAHSLGREDVPSWLAANAGVAGFRLLEGAYTVWLCVAAYRGRRWALVGLAFDGAYAAYPAILDREWGNAFVGSSTLVYSALRAIPAFGPRHPRPSSPEAFLPDRFVAATLAILDTGTTISFILRPPPGSEVNATYILWFLLSISQILWFQAAAYRSRGWAIGVGLMFTAMGFFVQLDHPEQRLQRVEAVVGFLYFSSRFAGLGPRPKGFLGMDSESGDERGVAPV